MSMEHKQRYFFTNHQSLTNSHRKTFCHSVKFISMRVWSLYLFSLCILLRLMKYANSILDSKLKGESLLSHECEDSCIQTLIHGPFCSALFLCLVCGPDLVMSGVGFHHAGVDLSDRKLIENAFTVGDLPVLCETLSLIMFYHVL